jgi:putative ABC transport system substrate-binding protein
LDSLWLGRRALLAGAIGLLQGGGPEAVAQERKRRVGFLSSYTEASGASLLACFRKGLADLGWVDGRNLELQVRWADSQTARLQGLAEELNGLGLDLIASNSTPAAQALKRVVTRTPVVFMSVSDPVASGIVSSLARPGANFTGLSNFFPAVGGKLADLARILLPSATRLGVMTTPDNAGKELDRKELAARAGEAGIAVTTLHVRTPEDIDAGFDRAGRDKLDAVIVFVDPVTIAHREQIVARAQRAAIPAIYQVRDFVDAGGLMSYGLNLCAHFARAASYADRILRGTAPADLPVELPSEFELVVNMKTARALRLVIPPLVLARAELVNE